LGDFFAWRINRGLSPFFRITSNYTKNRGGTGVRV
jgi:hypothetical protein